MALLTWRVNIPQSNGNLLDLNEGSTLHLPVAMVTHGIGAPLMMALFPVHACLAQGEHTQSRSNLIWSAVLEQEAQELLISELINSELILKFIELVSCYTTLITWSSTDGVFSVVKWQFSGYFAFVLFFYTDLSILASQLSFKTSSRIWKKAVTQNKMK